MADDARLDPTYRTVLDGSMTTVSQNRRLGRPPRRLLSGCVLVILLMAATQPGAQAQSVKDAATSETDARSGKGKRYASLKVDRVDLRQGPGADSPKLWVFQRMGLPVEIMQEQESWRKVRDAAGTTGWVHSSLLSTRRTALVLPWQAKEGVPQGAPAILRESDRETARPVAQVEPGVLAGIIGCEGGWCRITVGSFRGYIEQTKLWGTFPDEEIK
jgi:SH3-like domain-containing protein